MQPRDSLSPTATVSTLMAQDPLYETALARLLEKKVRILQFSFPISDYSSSHTAVIASSLNNQSPAAEVTAPSSLGSSLRAIYTTRILSGAPYSCSRPSLGKIFSLRKRAETLLKFASRHFGQVRLLIRWCLFLFGAHFNSLHGRHIRQGEQLLLIHLVFLYVFADSVFPRSLSNIGCLPHRYNRDGGLGQ